MEIKSILFLQSINCVWLPWFLLTTLFSKSDKLEKNGITLFDSLCSVPQRLRPKAFPPPQALAAPYPVNLTDTAQT